MRLLLTGDVMDVAEARALGLVEDVVGAGQAESAARALCARIAAHVPVATQAVKASVRMGIAAGLESGLRYENEMNTLCFTTGDHTKGIEAFQRKKD